MTLLRKSRFAGAEAIRIAIVLALGLGLMSGFMTSHLRGGGDARWYASMVADVAQQVRAGVFPVWIGQSEYQFNGSIYPLRVAPAFLNLSAGLDELTLHHLAPYALQNLLIVLVGLGSILSFYLCLAQLLPGRRSLAVPLAVVAFGCPGILAVAYGSDLFMSWSALLFAPFVFFALVDGQDHPEAKAPSVLLGAALGATWWCHSPIALWLTGISAGVFATRLLGPPGSRPTLAAAAITGGTFAAIAAYPLGSVLLFPADAAVGGTSFQGGTSAALIVEQIRAVFPRNFLPLSPGGRALSDLQLGYSLVGLLLFEICMWRQLERLARAMVLLAALVLVLAALPIPKLDLVLWGAVPAFVRQITARWVMNRLYVPLSGLVIFALPVLLRGLPARALRILFVVLCVGSLWTLVEARKFLAEAPHSPRDLTLLPENAILTKYAYFGFSRPPDYFTDGSTDPILENRLLDGTSGRLLESNLAAATRAGADQSGGKLFSRSSGGDELAPVVIRQSRHYLIDFKFEGQPDGLIQVRGTSLFREYALPDFGGPLAFGAGAPHATAFGLSATIDDAIQLHVIPGPASDSTNAVVEATLKAYDPESLPVLIRSWIPYRARVITGQAAWLETPRMFQTSYRAWVNGRPATVVASRQGLASIPLPSGTSEVELRFVPPWGLATLFWFSLTAAAAAAALIATRGAKNGLRRREL